MIFFYLNRSHAFYDVIIKLFNISIQYDSKKLIFCFLLDWTSFILIKKRRNCGLNIEHCGTTHVMRFLPESTLFMMTSSNGNIFRVTDHMCGEFTGPGEFPTQRPVSRSFDVYFDLRPNKWLSKQSWGWWFETLSCSLWRHRNVISNMLCIIWKKTSRPLYDYPLYTIEFQFFV